MKPVPPPSPENIHADIPTINGVAFRLSINHSSPHLRLPLLMSLIEREATHLFDMTGRYPYEILSGLHALRYVERLPEFKSSEKDLDFNSGSCYCYRGKLRQYTVAAVRPEDLPLDTLLLWSSMGKTEIKLIERS